MKKYLIFGLILAACGPKQKTDNSHQRREDTSGAPENIQVDPGVMIIELNPVKFINAFPDIPFMWNENHISKLRIKLIKWKVTTKVNGKWFDKEVMKSWTFNESGQPVDYAYTEQGKPVHRESNEYKNGQIIKNTFINDFAGWEVSSSHTYNSKGKLSKITDSDGTVFGFTYTGDRLTGASKGEDKWQYLYENEKLVSITNPKKGWTKKYGYDEQGRWNTLTSDKDYKDSYTLFYDGFDRIKKVEWLEKGKPLCDIIFELDENGKIIRITKKGYVAAMAEEEKMDFEYEYY